MPGEAYVAEGENTSLGWHCRTRERATAKAGQQAGRVADAGFARHDASTLGLSESVGSSTLRTSGGDQGLQALGGWAEGTEGAKVSDDFGSRAPTQRARHRFKHTIGREAGLEVGDF